MRCVGLGAASVAAPAPPASAAGDSSGAITFRDALFRGLAPDGSLYLPIDLPRFSEAEVEGLLSMARRERVAALARRLLGDEFGAADAERIAVEALDFPIPLVPLRPGLLALELFHGPTLAFKDVGARFMARAMASARSGREGPITILTATSGDTGSAVAHAFHGVPGIDVVVLYPAGRISRVQEMQMATLGDNIHALAVAGSFDDCQRLVKTAFADPGLRAATGLTTANSMNLGRLVPQLFYYYDLLAELRRLGLPDPAVVAVPSGNFGNVTAGLLAVRTGLPITRFLAATNANDTVPRYLCSRRWEPAATRETPSSAMDVALPNNWPRVEALLAAAEPEGTAPPPRLDAVAVSDADTIDTIRRIHEVSGYVLDPHGAVGVRALELTSRPDAGPAVVLATAHPAKFNDVMTRALGTPVPLPESLAACLERPHRGGRLDAEPSALAGFLRRLAATS